MGRNGQMRIEGGKNGRHDAAWNGNNAAWGDSGRQSTNMKMAHKRRATPETVKSTQVWVTPVQDSTLKFRAHQ